MTLCTATVVSGGFLVLLMSCTQLLSNAPQLYQFQQMICIVKLARNFILGFITFCQMTLLTLYQNSSGILVTVTFKACCKAMENIDSHGPCWGLPFLKLYKMLCKTSKR